MSSETPDESTPTDSNQPENPVVQAVVRSLEAQRANFEARGEIVQGVVVQDTPEESTEENAVIAELKQRVAYLQEKVSTQLDQIEEQQEVLTAALDDQMSVRLMAAAEADRAAALREDTVAASPDALLESPLTPGMGTGRVNEPGRG